MEMNIPIPISEVDQDSYNQILSVPWLKACIAPTGARWGRRIADVKLSRLPQHLLGQVMMSDETDAVNLVIFRWDRYDYEGWDKPFPVVLTFPDDSVYEVEVPQSSKLEDWHSVRVPINPGTLLRERPQQKEREIPRVIYNLSAPLNKQLSQEVRRLLRNVRQMTDLMQCTCLYLVIEDEAARREVQHSGLPGFIEAYTALRTGSFRADLMRYWLLYRYGGVYMDDKTFMRHGLDSDNMDHVLGDRQVDGARGTTDGPPADGSGPTQMFIGVCRSAEIAFMGARRGSPIILKALTTAISNINERFYGNHRLGITGNIMFQKILDSGIEAIPVKQDSLLGETRCVCWGEKVVKLPITLSDERIMSGDDILWQRQAIPRADWPRPSNYYADLWNQYLVYSDRNPDRPLLQPPMAAETKREIIAYTLTILAFIGVGFLIAQYPPIDWL